MRGSVSTQPVRLPWAPLGRLLRSWVDKGVLVGVILASGIGLTLLDSHVIRPGRRLEPAYHPGSGVSVRAEVLHLWLPVALIDLARRESRSSLAQADQELRISLERRGQQNQWYALTTRFHQANGGVAEITFIRRPYREPQHFREFLDVLARAAPIPPRDPTLNYYRAELHILPRELTEREPREVIDELLSKPFRTCDRSQE
jgi:hypothetical protein